MKGKTVLKRQAVKRRRRNYLPSLLKASYLFGSFSVKFCLLLAIIAGISLLFLSLYQYLLTSPYIKLERVIVSGVEGHLKREILDQSNLSIDTSLLAIDMDALKEKMERHPWIRSVRLEKRFPHTLIIRAEKERPYAVVVMNGLYYMNRWGEIFEKVDQTGDIDFPLITGISMTTMDQKMKLKSAAQVLKALEGEKGAFSLDQVSEVYVKNRGNVSLYFRSLPAVVELDSAQLRSKIAELKRLVKHLKRTGHIHTVRSINLNYRDGVVVSYKKS